MRIHRKRKMLAMTLAAWVVAGCTAQLALTEPRNLTVPSDIDATGAADVTDGLNTFFASVPDSSTILFPAGAQYRVEGTLLLIGRRKLTIEGNGATVLATTDGSGVTPPPLLAHLWPRGRRQFLFSGGADIVVRNLVVKGANPNAGTGDSAYKAPLEAQHGFEFAGVRGGELDHVTVSDVYGDFVYLGASGGQQASHIWIHDSHFERNGRQGVSFTGADTVLIERNYLAEVRRAHFDIEPNLATDEIRGVTIRDNRFGPGRLLFLASGGAPGTVEDITIANNVLIGKALIIQVTPPVGTRRSRIHVTGNVSDMGFGSAGSLMAFDRIDDLEVSGNRNPLQANRAMTAITVRESCGVVVKNNDFPGSVAEVAIVSPSCVP
jgi:hypothetical protein